MGNLRPELSGFSAKPYACIIELIRTKTIKY